MQQFTELTLALSHTSNKILLGMKKRGHGVGKYNGFGGKVESGESIESAARREIEEEIGVMPKTLDHRGTLFFKKTDRKEIFKVYVFLFTFEGTPTESEEIKPEYFSIEDIPYGTMWAADTYWIPVFLKGEHFTGEFHFDKEDNMISHILKVERHEHLD